jgi:hypothetical protein
MYCRAPKQNSNNSSAQIQASNIPPFPFATPPVANLTSLLIIAATAPSMGPTLSNHELLARLEEAEEAFAWAKDKFGTDF